MATNNSKPKPKPFDTVSSGTLNARDLVPAFLSYLEEIDYEAWQCLSSELLESLTEAISQHTPPYCYFGGHGADFGFWPWVEHVWDLIAEGELPAFSDLAEVPEDLSKDFAIVNDHGNLSLYNDKGEEIWAGV